MAKQIKNFNLEVRSENSVLSGFVRYSINDSIEADLNKYGEFIFDASGSLSLDDNLVAVNDGIKTRENIA